MNKKTIKPRSKFSKEDKQIIDNMIGTYPARVIAQKIGTSESCITRYCQEIDVSMNYRRSQNGLTPFYLAKLWDMNHNTITHWIKKHDMPLVKPKEKIRGKRHFTIIDEKLLPKWLEKGYALSDAIQPITTDHIKMISDAREKIYDRMIPTVMIADILYVGVPTLYHWIRTGLMLKPDFVYKKKMYHNRVPLTIYFDSAYGKKAADRVLNTKWSKQ
jgi:hypothetical protein